MSAVSLASGIELEYESLGEESNPPILLIMGLGCQLSHWPDAFCQELVDYGYRVIRFDNRDVGLSSKLDHHPVQNLVKLALRQRLGLKITVPYTLHDMVEDTLGLLDALKLKNAHIVGASMGGMIGQMLSALNPDRVQSLTTIMSSSGHPKLPLPKMRILKSLLIRPNYTDRDQLIDYYMGTWQSLSSPEFPPDLLDLRERVTKNLDRSYDPNGYKRQISAISATPAQWKHLPKIECPTLVVHGEDDPLNQIEHGKDVATRISGANFLPIKGMGHTLHAPFISQITEAIHGHIQDLPSSVAA